MVYIKDILKNHKIPPYWEFIGSLYLKTLYFYTKYTKNPDTTLILKVNN